MGFETETTDRPGGDALGQVEQLQKRIAELERLLREHLVQLSTQPAREMQEDAKDLLDRAECIGCQGHIDSAQVRLCRCGSVLPDESQYCGKCGGLWSPGAPMSHSCQQLAAEISHLTQQIEDAEQVLRASLAEAGTGGTESCFTMSRVLGPPEMEDVSQEELDQRDMLLQQRTRQGLRWRNLEDLKKAKLLAETRLLAQRNAELARESGVAAMTALDEEAQAACYCDGVNCQYRRQVEVLQEMVKTLRGLSNEMGEKLQQATGEHLQMTMALTTVQGSLQEAVQVVDQSARDVDAEPDKAALKRMLTNVCTALKETKRRSDRRPSGWGKGTAATNQPSGVIKRGGEMPELAMEVFWRLYNNHGRRPKSSGPGAQEGKHRQEKRAALVHKTQEHLYKLDSTGRTVSHEETERPTAVLHVAETSILPPSVPPLPDAAATALTPKQIMLPAIDKAMKSEKSEKSTSKEKSAVPISAVNLFVANEEHPSLQPMAPVFSPRKQPPTVRRYSKRSGAPSVAMPVFFGTGWGWLSLAFGACRSCRIFRPWLPYWRVRWSQRGSMKPWKRLSCNCQACLAWRSCGSLLGPLHSAGGSLGRAVEILRLAVCELSDIVERCGAPSPEPVAAGVRGPRTSPESETHRGRRRTLKAEREVEEESSLEKKRSRSRKTSKEKRREKRGDRPESHRERSSPVRKEVSQSSHKEKRRTRDKDERSEEKVRKKKQREVPSQSPVRSGPARPAAPRSPSGPPARVEVEKKPLAVKEEVQSEEEGPAAPPGSWVLPDAPTSTRSSTASLRSGVRLKPPEPPGPPPGWGSPSTSAGQKRSKGVARRERARDINLYGRPAAAAPAEEPEEPLRRVRRRPAGEAEEEPADPPVPARLSAEEALNKFNRGEEIEAVALAPGALPRGEWIVAVQGSYFQQKAGFAFKLEKEELDGGERELCGVLTGTDSEALLRFATGNKPCHIQVHLCPPECPQLRENPNLLHTKKIRKILPDTALTWENNLIEEAETSLLQAEAEDWRKKKEAERREKKRRSSSTSPSTKKKKKRKKKKKKEERAEEVELKAPAKGRLGGRSVATKDLSTLFYGTGLDPSWKNRKKILKRLKKSLKKSRDSSSSTGSSSTSTSTDVEDAQILEDRSKLQKIATRAPGVLAAQGIRNMLDYLHQYSGTNWGTDQQQLPPVLCQYHRTYLLPKLSGGVGREAATLSWIGDLMLQGRVSESMDCLLQRLKSLEQTANGSPWSISQKLEIVPPPTASIGSRSELQVARREARLDQQVLPQTSLVDKGKGKTKEKGREKGKEKGRGKGKEAKEKPSA
eukprot:s660_g12.t1